MRSFEQIDDLPVGAVIRICHNDEPTSYQMTTMTIYKCGINCPQKPKERDIMSVFSWADVKGPMKTKLQPGSIWAH
jgi:hypothetical protein